MTTALVKYSERPEAWRKWEKSDDGKWHFFVLVNDCGRCAIYVDGKECLKWTVSV